MSIYEIGPLAPQIDPAVLDQLRQADVATIGHWRHWGFCDPAIQRLSPGKTIVGTAFTVSCPAPDNSALHYAISLVRPGDIIFVERPGGSVVACAGAVVLEAAIAAGASAFVIDGPCTDIQELRGAEWPVWCRGVSGRTTKVGELGGRINVPVSIGGVVVMPGDAVLGDDDGLLVMRPEEAAAEAERAIERQTKSGQNVQLIRNGANLADISGARLIIEKATKRK